MVIRACSGAVAVALLGLCALPASAQPYMLDVENRMAIAFSQHCLSAIDVSNYAGASIHCQSAAEHWGNVAAVTANANERDDALRNEAQYLALAGVSNSFSGQKSLGRQQLRSARNVASRIRAKDVRNDAQANVALAIKKADL